MTTHISLNNSLQISASDSSLKCRNRTGAITNNMRLVLVLSKNHYFCLFCVKFGHDLF